MLGIRAVWRYGRTWVTSPAAHLLISGMRTDRIVAYPRSGSTWLRTMIVNVLDPSAQSNPDIFNRVIPAVSLTRLPLVWGRPKPRLLMTHGLYFGGHKKTLYVIRDGRDSIMSFFRFTTTRVGTDIEFSKWLDFYLKGYYGPRWDQHVKSWLTCGREELGSALMLVRYEEMRSDAASVLRRVCDYVGIGYSDESINYAVKMSGVEIMRGWERKTVGEIANKNASFYRGGNREWESVPSREDKEKILAVSDEMMCLAGYQL